ncbi:hypothetical protein SPRG_12430 [Saprolegnia parasitica CBS 223.65]|uniref:Putative auto-transporter adhesin head GIN domain-containing protein n=1 Tax=Saprolegnia parasitica (strain CBS 223.65) TaxID=695850 RepID=A0A067BT34_SAPPC|nr:hypothetical protein SPRG_12430 [Saprolegnia parasitica CBS 223.65]KDO21423.1 hypothetical protein SPRG_12430 [Saprolegnia parasitica CBS 223.65]|eukprot:XP_012207870.1 hypothetical protein SPRG_12430 [Saprolegnia parasitica CBS 223.65]
MAASSWPVKIYNSSSITTDSLKVPLHAFIRAYDAPTPSIVVRADTQVFLDSLAFQDDGKVLGFDLDHDGYDRLRNTEVRYLIDVYMPTRSLASLRAMGSGDVVVTPSALQNTSVVLTTAGSGTVFVSAPSIELANLNISVSGSGGFQWDVPATKVTSGVDLSVSGSGTLALSTTTLDAGSLKMAVAGSGKAYVGASSLVNVSSSVATSVAGSGQVNLYAAGTCRDHKVSISGSGDAFVSAMNCRDTSAVIAGSGSAYIQSTTTLATSVAGSGRIYVAGTVPGGLPGSYTPMASPPVTTYNAVPVPAYEPHKTKFGSHVSTGTSWTRDNATLIGVLVAVLIVLLVAFGVYRCRKSGRACFRSKTERPVGYARKTSTENQAPSMA